MDALRKKAKNVLEGPSNILKIKLSLRQRFRVSGLQNLQIYCSANLINLNQDYVVRAQSEAL